MTPLFSLLFSFLLVSLPLDHSEWDRFLKKFVNEKGEVNYPEARKDPSLLDAYLDKIKKIPVKEMDEWPREERLALILNTYNAGIIKLVLKYYPFQTVMTIPGFWDDPGVPLGSYSGEAGEEPRMLSLNTLENAYLRQTFRDEKILFAFTKAARGSPPLRREAFSGPRVEGQLYEMTQQFVNDPVRNRLEPGAKKIVLPKIFQWYGEDFLVNWSDFPGEVKWNPQEMAILSFFVHYLDDPGKIEYLKTARFKIKYDVFDWTLNEAR